MIGLDAHFGNSQQVKQQAGPNILTSQDKPQICATSILRFVALDLFKAPCLGAWVLPFLQNHYLVLNPPTLGHFSGRSMMPVRTPRYPNVVCGESEQGTMLGIAVAAWTETPQPWMLRVEKSHNLLVLSRISCFVSHCLPAEIKEARYKKVQGKSVPKRSWSLGEQMGMFGYPRVLAPSSLWRSTRYAAMGQLGGVNFPASNCRSKIQPGWSLKIVGQSIKGLFPNSGAF